jgi:hypothetical protein
MLAICALAGEARAAGPTLSADGDPGAGYVTLSWGTEGAVPTGPVYELQQSLSADFESPRVRYEGTQTSSVLSGIPDGTRYFRVRAKSVDGAWGDWSEPVKWDVKHHSLATAATLMGIGAIVFAITAWFIAKGEDLAKE